MVPSWFPYLVYVLIAGTCSLLIPDELFEGALAVASWLSTLLHHPTRAVAILWEGFWGSWTAVIVLTTTLFSFFFSPTLVGYMTTKVFVVLAMFIIFGRCCVAEEIHGASDRRRELATRISSVTIIALLLSSLTFLKAGVLENSRRGLAPTLKNIWHASLWWKSPSGAPLPGPFGHSTTESTAANNHKLASAKEHKTHITTSLKKDKISEVRPSIEEKEPRLGIGVDPYQNVTHEQVAQWTIEESDKIAALANDYITGKRGPPLTNTKPDSLRFFFTTDYDKLYGSDVKDLRAEVLRRLGPPGKDPDEEDHWIMDIAIRDQSRASGMDPFLSPYDVRDYAPYLRNLGLRLKAKADSR